jgi:hypothetical protein
MPFLRILLHNRVKFGSARATQTFSHVNLSGPQLYGKFQISEVICTQYKSHGLWF